MMTGIKILGTGMYVPQKVITNDDLSKLVDTSDEWISTRTGMKERHYAAENEGTTFMAKQAAEQAIINAGIDRSKVGAVVVATVSADNYAPSTAALMQRELNLEKEIIAIDVNAGCSGFIFGLQTLRGLLMTTEKEYGLLIASETLSRKMDMTDRSTCVLFGDGAAAMVIRLDENKFFKAITGVESDDEMINIKVPNGKIHMDGQATYKFAVATVPRLIEKIVADSALTPEQIDHYILHQANLRIIDSIAQRLKQPMDKFEVNIEKYGNTSAVSVGLVMAEADKKGIFKDKDMLLLCAFGAGKTYGAIVLEW